MGFWCLVCRLFIVDLAHMPAGCGTWPAFWLVGPGWPNDGEIDIIEGVNNAASDTTTLHSSQGCSQAGVADSEFTGKRSVGKNGRPATDCWVKDPNEFGNQGCGISAGTGSYGAPFNAVSEPIATELISNPISYGQSSVITQVVTDPID